jgi:hypothetical protein
VQHNNKKRNYFTSSQAGASWGFVPTLKGRTRARALSLTTLTSVDIPKNNDIEMLRENELSGR